MEFFDGWKLLNSHLNASDLTAPTQLVMYKLFYMFDAQRFPESLLVSDRELMSMTGIKSTRSIVEARRQLKNLGLIDFKTCAGKPTIYRLGSVFAAESKQLPNTFETQSKHLVNTSETPETNSNIRARTSPITITDTDIRRERGSAPEKILEIWSEETGYRLHGTNARELVSLGEENGLEKVKAAIVKAVAHHKDSLEYVKAILKNGIFERSEKVETANNARVVSFNRADGGGVAAGDGRTAARRNAPKPDSASTRDAETSSRFTATDTSWIYATLGEGEITDANSSKDNRVPAKSKAYG